VVISLDYDTTGRDMRDRPFEAVLGLYVTALPILAAERWLVEINQKITEDAVKLGTPAARPRDASGLNEALISPITHP